MQVRTFPALIAAMALGTGFMAQAATINAIQGSVLVNQGGGYLPASGSMTVNAGDLIMAGPGSSARLVYSDGCTVEVQAEGVVTVGATSTCAAGAVNEPPPPNAIVAPNTTLLIGGLAIAGGVGLALALSGGSDNKKDTAPASP